MIQVCLGYCRVPVINERPNDAARVYDSLRPYYMCDECRAWWYVIRAAFELDIPAREMLVTKYFGRRETKIYCSPKAYRHLAQEEIATVFGALLSFKNSIEFRAQMRDWQRDLSAPIRFNGLRSNHFLRPINNRIIIAGDLQSFDAAVDDIWKLCRRVRTSRKLAS